MKAFLKRFNAHFSKAHVSEPDYVVKDDPELNSQEQARMEISKKYALSFAEHVSEVVSKEQFEFLSQYHNYTDIRFGARRVARVINYARSIMDYEVNHPEPGLEKTEFNWAMDILILASFCHLLPGVFALSCDNYNEKTESIIRTFVSMSNSEFSEEEVQLIVDAAIHSKSIPPNKHIVIDVMCDAMVIDDQYYDSNIAEQLLRCRASKQVAFLTWSKKVSVKNLSPNWVTYLQEIWGVDNLSLVNADNLSAYNRETERDDML